MLPWLCADCEAEEVHSEFTYITLAYIPAIYFYLDCIFFS